MRCTLFPTLLLAACSGVAPDLTSVPHAAPETGLATGEFPGAAALLAGFDERSASASWGTGDQVLFGLRLRKGDVVQRWLLHLQVELGERLLVADADGSVPLESMITVEQRQIWSYTVTIDGKPKEMKISSNMLPVAVRVCDQEGKVLGHCRVTLPSTLLSAGILPAIEASLSEPSAESGGAEAAPVREEQVRPMVEAVIGLMSLLNVVREDQVLADYFWQVVEKPSIWSVITRFGVSTTLRLPFEKSVPTDVLPAHLPPVERAFVAPMQIDVNQNPALLIDIVATPALRPYALCGGMVAATARHPSDPSVKFEVVLLAARLGAEARVKMKPGATATPAAR